MSEIIRIKRGLDIKLQGRAEKIIHKAERSATYAIKPTDFKDISIKLTVKPGDKVKIGTPLFFDKDNPRIVFTSPVSGAVSEIVRGERRMIQAVVIQPGDSDDYISFDIADQSRENVIKVLLESGMWPVIRQRPYSSVADPADTPKAIFISGFDTAPLAPDMNFLVNDSPEEFQKGIDILGKLTRGLVHLSLNRSSEPSGTYLKAAGVVRHEFTGPHPSGNVGIQIHHIDPVNKGDVVWYLSPVDVIRIGKLFIGGRIDNSAIIAVAGSEVKNPRYFKCLRGASVAPMLKENISEGEVRIISGNVLTGTRIEKDGFIGFYDHLITVIPEGKYFDFLGWALPGTGKYSVSRSFFSWLTPGRNYRLDTNLKGGHRAYVVTGEYEKVFPMDIYPLHLIKAILAEDIEKMENLGIYEVAEEDFALCEFVCTSKTDVQSIIRKGLELMKKEMG